MTQSVFGFHFGVSDLDKIVQVQAIAQSIVNRHPDVKDDIERLLKLVVESSRTNL